MKMGRLCFQPGPTQTSLCSVRRGIESRNFAFNKKKDCTICKGKTKVLISCAVTAQLICIFVLAKEKPGSSLVLDY